MAEGNKRHDRVILYESVINQLFELDVLRRDELFKMICDYGLYGKEPESYSDQMIKLVFMGIKPNLDYYYRSHDNGKTGGRGHKKKKASADDDDQNDEEPEEKTKQKNKKRGVCTVTHSQIQTYTEKDKEKNKEIDSDTEEESYFFNSYSLDSENEKHAVSSSGDYADASPEEPRFSFSECLTCRDTNHIDLTDDQMQDFYNRMVKSHWTIKGTAVKNLKNAITGYKNHIADNNRAAGQDPTDQIINELNNWMRSNKDKPFNQILNAAVRLVGKPKYKRILNESMQEFINQPTADIFTDLELYFDPTEEAADEKFKCIRENKRDVVNIIVSQSMKKCYEEVGNNLSPRDRDKWLDGNTAPLDKKIRTILTVSELDLLSDYSCSVEDFYEDL